MPFVSYDRDVKVPLYARSAIPEMWLVDLVNARVERFTQPAAQGYQRSHRSGRGDLESYIERFRDAVLRVI